MSLNPVITMLGRRLRLALVGGGPGSFIGAMHRQAARLDDRYELVSSVLCSDAERSRAAGKELGLDENRVHSDVETMLDTEAARLDGADVVAIMTPNDSHFPYAQAALEKGFDVICDKPMTNTRGRGRGTGPAGRRIRPDLLPDPQLHRLSDGAPGPGHG